MFIENLYPVQGAAPCVSEFETGEVSKGIFFGTRLSLVTEIFLFIDSCKLSLKQTSAC